MDLQKILCRLTAGVFISLMIIAGLPLYVTSNMYSWQYNQDKAAGVARFISLVLGPLQAEAAAPRVICVPQTPTDLLVPHETWADKPTILKGVAKDENYENIPAGTYYWDFGDGTYSHPLPIIDSDNLGIQHTYAGSPDTLFIARLYVTDTSFFLDHFSTNSIDEYSVVDRGHNPHNSQQESGWYISDGYLRQDYSYGGGDTGGTLLLKNDLTASDITAALHIRGSDDDIVGIVLRYHDINNFYRACVSEQNQEAFIQKCEDGVFTTLASAFYDYRYNSSHHLSFSAVGDTLKLDINGYEIVRTTDSSHESGRFGVNCDDFAGFRANYFAAATGMSGEVGSDEYRVILKEKNLGVEVNKAIDDGLWHLYRARETVDDQYRWRNRSPDRTNSEYSGNATASCIQAFEIHGHVESGNPEEDPYAAAVYGGIDYLMTRLSTHNMSLQRNEDPDSNQNGIGLSAVDDRPVYETGAIMDALVASGTPDAIARTGGANVMGRRYQDIVQDMVDMYAWGQAEDEPGFGGWRYVWNSNSDNSAAQWAAIGMVAAERHFGCVVPQWVKDRNNYWLSNSYNGVGFGYRSAGNDWATTPSGMVQLAFVGREVTDPRWQTSEAHIADNWLTFLNQWDGLFSYGYYAFAKAMQLAIPDPVTHLSATGLDWYGDSREGMARHLVDHQSISGSWPGEDWLGNRLATSWNVIILARTLFNQPPVGVITIEPNPSAGQCNCLERPKILPHRSRQGDCLLFMGLRCRRRR